MPVSRLIRPDILSNDERLYWSTGTGNQAWAMFIAAATGDVDTIIQLLKKDPALVRTAYDYRTPMGFAVRYNQLEAARVLLDHDASPVDSGTDDTLLQIARDRGHQEMAALIETFLVGKYAQSTVSNEVNLAIRHHDWKKLIALLDADPSLVHQADHDSNRPIHWAVMTRQPEMIDILLERGADINTKRADGALPIQLVNGDYSFRGWRDVASDHPVKPRDVLQFLRDRGAYVDICTASYIGDINRVRELLSTDPSLANKPSVYVSYYALSGTPLRNAADAGHIEIVRLLLEHGADPNHPEEGIAPFGHALHMAVCNNHMEIVQLLLDHGAYPNVEIESSADTLSAAMSRKNQSMIDLLCSYGAARKLHLLAYYGDLVVAAAMLSANPSLANDPNALENAATEGHDAFVRLMLHYQPDLATKIAVGARSKGPDGPIASRELTEYLFSKGMDANKANWLRITPLHTFARRNDIKQAGYFLDHGADINAIDEELNTTPLGYAAKYGKKEMVELLLARGADKQMPYEYPWSTPLEWAKRRNFPEIIKLLV